MAAMTMTIGMTAGRGIVTGNSRIGSTIKPRAQATTGDTEGGTMINTDKPNAVKARPRVMPISYAMVRKLVTIEIAVSQGPGNSTVW